MQIHKQAIPLGQLKDYVTLQLPLDAAVVSIGNQRECLAFWYTTGDRLVRPRRFRVAGTGHSIENSEEGRIGRFLGTVQFADGDLVFHVFEVL